MKLQGAMVAIVTPLKDDLTLKAPDFSGNWTGTFGLKVTVGAWIDKDPVRNEVEMLTAIELANQHRSVTSLVIGNETIYRADQTVAEIISKIKRVKREIARVHTVLTEKSKASQA